jgi:hypothetical protein
MNAKRNRNAGVEEHQNKEGSEIHSSANPFPLSRTNGRRTTGRGNDL